MLLVGLSVLADAWFGLFALYLRTSYLGTDIPGMSPAGEGQVGFMQNIPSYSYSVGSSTSHY